MAQATQGSGGSQGPGDTLEFLRIMGAAPPADLPAGQGQAPAGRAGAYARSAGPTRQPTDDIESFAMRSHARTQAAPAFDVATLSIPPITSRRDDSEPKPVVIKGGPRRVVRADGVRPDTDEAHMHRRFRLSSGHPLFTRHKRISKPLAILAGLLGIALFALIVWGSWTWAQVSIRAEKQADLIDTSDYDTVLSLTPANDAGYYTILLVTSTTTDEESIGALSQVLMFRTDKDVTSATKVVVPTDLAVASTTYGTQSLATVLSDPDRGVNPALQAVVNSYGIRLYECAVMSQDVFDQIYAVMNGTASADSVDQDALVGRMRTSFTTQELVDFAAKIAALGGESTLVTIQTPLTVATDANGAPVETTSADQYLAALNAVFYPTDEWGNPAGTVYQTYEDGSLVFGDDGLPIVAG